MAYETKDGDISVFKNDKQGNDKRPDYRGTAQLGGVEHSVSLWVRTSKTTGGKFFSGKIEPKRDRPQSSQQPQALATISDRPAPPNAADSDLPF